MNVDISISHQICLGFKYTAQQLGMPLARWIQFCSGWRLNETSFSGLPRNAYKESRAPKQVTFEDVAGASTKTRRITINLSRQFAEAIDAAAQQQETSRSKWLHEACFSWLAPELFELQNLSHEFHRAELSSLQNLARRVLHIYYLVDLDAKRHIEMEFDLHDISALGLCIGRKLQLQPELESLFLRVAELVDVPDLYPNYNDELDLQLKFYFGLIKQKPLPADWMNNAEFLANNPGFAFLLNCSPSNRVRRKAAEPPARKTPKQRSSLVKMCANVRLTDDLRALREQWFVRLLKWSEIAKNTPNLDHILQGEDPADPFVNYVRVHLANSSDVLKDLQTKIVATRIYREADVPEWEEKVRL